MTNEETAAAIKALHHAREQSRTALKPWPTIEQEVQIVLEAAGKVRRHNLKD